jgi:spermidine synthase
MVAEMNQTNTQLARNGVYVLFFLSGLSALIYQVTWMRYLSLFFGSDVYSTAITLSSFMCGLSFGSYVAHKWAKSINRPLMVFAVLELFIGLYAISFPTILSLFHDAFKEVYLRSIDSAPIVYNGFRALIAGAVLVVPTAMMGASLPFISEQFSGEPSHAGSISGKFYATNTAGAVFGVLIGGFLLFPFLGFGTTTLIAATLNIAISLFAMTISIHFIGHAKASALSSNDEAQANPNTGSNASRVRASALMTISLSGFAAMALEVVVTRWLALSFSATVYSFSVMLACFLIGIAYGSSKASEWVKVSHNPAKHLGIIELLLALSVFLIASGIALFPALFGNALWSLVHLTNGNFAVASVISMLLSALLVLFIPTLLLGASFPFAVRVWTLAGLGAGHGVGGVYSANTLGALLGALAAAFLMIPFLGLRGSFVLIGAVFLISSWLMFIAPTRWNPRSFVFPIIVTILGSFVAFFVHSQPKQIIANYHMQRTENPKVIYHGEGVAHTVDIVEGGDRNTIMMVDGNIEADTTYLQRRHFVLKGHLPLLLHRNPKSALVVGLGLGITLSNTLRHPTLSNVQVVELSPEMVEAQHYLKTINDDVLANSKLSLRIDDARNYLSLEDKKFDMITADPIHPRISGVGYLYTSEYYRTIKNHLNGDGVICQWMPMYSISPASFRVAFQTFAKEFPNSSFWYVRGHGLFVGQVGNKPIDYSEVVRRFNNPTVKQDLNSIGISSPSELFGHMLMGPRQIEKYIAGTSRITLNTDDNAWLEHRTPSEFLSRTDEILEDLLPSAGFDRSYLTNASEIDYREIEAAWTGRKAKIFTELKEAIR